MWKHSVGYKHYANNYFMLFVMINIFLQVPRGSTSHLKCKGTFIVANFTKGNLLQQNKMHDNYKKKKQNSRTGNKRLLSN